MALSKMRPNQGNSEGRLKIEDYSATDLETLRENCVMYAAAMMEIGANPHLSERLEEIENELNRRKQA
jgi:hypothetical protein